MKTFVVICILAALGLGGWLFENRRMRMFWTRACGGGQWRGHFPDASKSEIRGFLRLFGRAFGFRNSRLLCFRPDDRVMDVYRTIYPPQWTLSDSMELESFAKSVCVRYGVDLFRLWRDDITLGEVFALTRPGSAEPGAAPNGGPATRSGNSGVTEGPPSVS